MKKHILFSTISWIILMSACTPATTGITPIYTQLSTSTSSPINSPVLTQKSNQKPTATPMHIACPPEEVSNTPFEGSYVGLQIPPEPTGIKSLDTLLIESNDEYFFGLSHMIDGQEQHFLWLEKGCHNQDEQRYTQIIDEVILPPLTGDEFVTTTCTLDDKSESKVAAIGYYREEIISGATYLKIIATRAWLIDTENWKFEELPTEQLDNLSCIYEHS